MITEIYSEYENVFSKQLPLEIETQLNTNVLIDNTANVVETKVEKKTDLKNLVNLFTSVKLKKPVLHLIDNDYKVKLSKAPDTGRNKGHLYVTYNKFYVGKITPNGVYIFTRTIDSPDFGEKKILEFLFSINENPVEQIERQGKATGICCCCGTKLTKEESVSRGIGPICLEKWAL